MEYHYVAQGTLELYSSGWFLIHYFFASWDHGCEPLQGWAVTQPHLHFHTWNFASLEFLSYSKSPSENYCLWSHSYGTSYSILWSEFDTYKHMVGEHQLPKIVFWSLHVPWQVIKHAMSRKNKIPKGKPQNYYFWGWDVTMVECLSSIRQSWF